MKYLKTYKKFNGFKLFESKDGVLNNIEDILFELYDEGYNIMKSTIIEEDWFSWTEPTYNKPFEDIDYIFDGDFEQLNITIKKDKSKYDSLRKSIVDKVRNNGISFPFNDELKLAIDWSNSFDEFMFNYLSGSRTIGRSNTKKYEKYQMMINTKDSNDVIELAKVHPKSCDTELAVYYKIEPKFIKELDIELADDIAI